MLLLCFHLFHHWFISKVEQDLRFIWEDQAKLKIQSSMNIIGRIKTLIKQSKDAGKRSFTKKTSNQKGILKSFCLFIFMGKEMLF